VPSGTYFCNGVGTAASNKTGIFAGVWADNTSSAPSKPRQSQLAAEAVRAAEHFGNTSASSNASMQYVIATTKNSSSGFGRQYCAYHSATSSTVGNVAYTNLCRTLPTLAPAVAPISTDSAPRPASQLSPATKWPRPSRPVSERRLAIGGAENGDKCAWISSGQGASTDISLTTGTFAVQSLWSNAFNSGSGGCVLTYP
jgi:hypothetical protein